jgi:hypothetical protein
MHKHVGAPRAKHHSVDANYVPKHLQCLTSEEHRRSRVLQAGSAVIASAAALVVFNHAFDTPLDLPAPDPVDGITRETPITTIGHPTQP